LWWKAIRGTDWCTSSASYHYLHTPSSNWQPPIAVRMELSRTFVKMHLFSVRPQEHFAAVPQHGRHVVQRRVRAPNHGIAKRAQYQQSAAAVDQRRQCGGRVSLRSSEARDDVLQGRKSGLLPRCATVSAAGLRVLLAFVSQLAPERDALVPSRDARLHLLSRPRRRLAQRQAHARLPARRIHSCHFKQQTLCGPSPATWAGRNRTTHPPSATGRLLFRSPPTPSRSGTRRARVSGRRTILTPASCWTRKFRSGSRLRSPCATSTAGTGAVPTCRTIRFWRKSCPTAARHLCLWNCSKSGRTGRRGKLVRKSSSSKRVRSLDQSSPSTSCASPTNGDGRWLCRRRPDPQDD
jgi:hypothetical protein